jgi:serine/threonine-protein kinase
MEHLDYPADVLGDRDTEHLANEQSRAYLQARVRFFAAVAFVLVGAHYLFINSLRTLVGKPLSDFGNPVAATHLGTFVVLLLCFGLAVGFKFSIRALSALDAFTTLSFVSGLTLLGYTARDSWAPEMVVLVGGTLALVARATLVPSASHRTLLIGVLGAAIMVAGIYFISAAADQSHVPAYYATIAASWTALSVTATVIASRTIYGLRQRVQAAERLGQYQLSNKIGEGAMGIVYRAQHALLKRPTAVKLLRPEVAAKRAVERFRREILLTASLEHPSTVAVYDCGQSRDGNLYYAMELLDGIDFYSVVKRFGPLEPERVVHLLLQACGSLAEAHEAGLIHRDIKPGNMMLCQRGGVFDVLKILDFGLVKESHPDPAQAKVSAENQIVGTPLYMAPEAIADPAKVDQRTDLYSLGATAYFMLSGHHVFDADERDVVFRQQLEAEPKRPSSRAPKPIPEALEDVILSCLEKKQSDRPESAAALSEKLTALGLAPAWTQARARAWWQTHDPSAHLRALSSAGATVAEPPRLLAPDPHATTHPAHGSTMVSPMSRNSRGG